MNTKQFLISSLIVVAGTVATAPARADGGFAPFTRADVKAQVLQARAAGELRPAGEASEPMAYRFGPSTRSRADVRAEVVMARLQGDLVPAGQGAHDPLLEPHHPPRHGDQARRLQPVDRRADRLAAQAGQLLQGIVARVAASGTGIEEAEQQAVEDAEADRGPKSLSRQASVLVVRVRASRLIAVPV